MKLPALSANAWLRWDRIDAVLRDIAGEAPLGDVLEIGAGLGGVGTRLALRSRYTGVEMDATSVATAQRRLARSGADGSFLHGDYEALLTSEARYDVVCAFEVLEHLEDDAAAVSAWAARLRPGGHLLLSVPADPARYREADQMAGHFRRYTPQGLASLLTAQGLDSVRVDYYGGPLGRVLERGRNVVARRRGHTALPPETVPVGSGPALDGSAFRRRTASSGRLLQPKDIFGPLFQAGTAPFRAWQTRFPGTGPGLIACGRRP